MDYSTFHAFFTFPPLLLLLVVFLSSEPRERRKRVLIAIGITSGIALVYTTPWDNYLIWKGIWHYGRDRVVGTIGYVPLEEYLFFLIQPFLTGLWFALLRHRPRFSRTSPPRWWRMTLSSVWALVTGGGAIALLMNGRGVYLGLILVWAGPVLVGLSWLGAEKVWAERRAFLLGVAAPTLYLWIADRLALGWGIWTISETWSLGISPLGLPVEEAVFFLVTNLLVVHGILLFLPDRSAIDER